MEDRTEADPEARARVQASFDRQGLMGHLGARLGHVAPGLVHIVLPARPEVTQQTATSTPGRPARSPTARAATRRSP